MHIFLIGNYLPDEQESMQRFAELLNQGFNDAGIESQIWRPKIIFGKWAKSTTSGFGKWLGYIDKWIVFSLILFIRVHFINYANKSTRFHICDHSNAPYLKFLPTDRTGITCHDVLAIRGGLGYSDAYTPASGLGSYLQKWILHHLSNTKLLASVSHLTLNQLIDLNKTHVSTQKRDWRVIHNSLNADFSTIESPKTASILSQHKLDQISPFILHVGSGTMRKNRKMLLDMVAALGNKWDGNICYAGQEVDENLLKHAKALGLVNRVISVKRPDHDTLVALYNACEAFIFPSFTEGFGWPLIEAQACGAPVIASNIQPMPEVSGGAALHEDPTKPKHFAEAFLLLKNNSIRESLINSGFENVKRFSPDKMIDSYIKLHNLDLPKPMFHAF